VYGWYYDNSVLLEDPGETRRLIEVLRYDISAAAKPTAKLGIVVNA